MGIIKTRKFFETTTSIKDIRKREDKKPPMTP